jgi:hypothetical protein
MCERSITVFPDQIWVDVGVFVFSNPGMHRYYEPKCPYLTELNKRSASLRKQSDFISPNC